MKKTAKIYVAGHTGLAGSAIVRQLKKQGYSQLLLRTHEELELTNQKAVSDFFAAEKPEYVFVAAAKVGGILANSIYRGEFIYKNIMIQSNIMHQSMTHGVRRLLFLGSSCAYPKKAPQPICESALLTGPVEPTNAPYAMAKLAGIEMCDAYNRQYKTSFVPVMPTNIYGPGDNYDLEKSHVLPALIRKFHLGKLAIQKNWDAIREDELKWGPIPKDFKNCLESPKGCKIPLWGTGAPLREFMHSEDMANACTYIMFQMDDTKLINIGTGQEVSIRDIAETVADVVGYDGPIIWDSEKPDGAPRKRLNISRLTNLGWTPKISLHDGLKNSYKLYLEN